jgi:hypothetical protein
MSEATETTTATDADPGASVRLVITDSPHGDAVNTMNTNRSNDEVYFRQGGR